MFNKKFRNQDFTFCLKPPMGKRTHDDGRPKGKVTAYVFFVRHQHEVNKDIKLPFSEFSKQCSKIWKDMTIAEKEPFQAQANADKERYSAVKKPIFFNINLFLKTMFSNRFFL